MANVNSIPSTNNGISQVKTLAFPYQLGGAGFPALSDVNYSMYANIVSLILTGRGERIMNPVLGANLYEYVFENMTPLQRARLANDITQTIERFLPSVTVLSVYPHDYKNKSGQNGVIFDIVYRVGGQDIEQQVEYVPTTQGV